MPVYTYITIEPDGSEGEIFEVEQSASSPALTRHPENDKPVKRVFDAPNIGIKHTPGSEKKLSETGRVKKAGFKIFERDKSGNYHEK